MKILRLFQSACLYPSLQSISSTTHLSQIGLANLFRVLVADGGNSALALGYSGILARHLLDGNLLNPASSQNRRFLTSGCPICGKAANVSTAACKKKIVKNTTICKFLTYLVLRSTVVTHWLMTSLTERPLSSSLTYHPVIRNRDKRNNRCPQN